MKSLVFFAFVLFATTGCATLNSPGGVQSNLTSASSSASLPDASPFPAQQPNMGAQLVLPTTGGAPVVGIPVGGNLFIPVTGGPPIPGISLNP